MIGSPSAPTVSDSSNDATAAADRSATGTLAITTDPSPLSIVVSDHDYRVAARGASPLTVELRPGLYAVRASQAGQPDLTTVASVSPDVSTPTHLSSADANVSPTTGFIRDLFDKYVYKGEPVLKVTSKYTTEEPPLKAQRFRIRFLKLKGWCTAELLAPLAFSTDYIGGRAILTLTNTHDSVVFAQIARASGAALNVSLPPAGARAVQCQLVVSATSNMLAAQVRLATDWANAALQYMAQGYIDQAREIIEASKGHFEQKPSIFVRAFRHIANRFDDPSAMLIPRYLGLRTGEDTSLSILGETLIDLFQQNLSDGFVISAEADARARKFKLAAQQILNIRPGRIPLFTEGFSLLIHRVGELLDLNPQLVDNEHRPEPDQIEQLKDLKRTLSMWAPYLHLNSPTVTFPGYDVTAPSITASPNVSEDADGWIQGPQPP